MKTIFILLLIHSGINAKSKFWVTFGPEKVILKVYKGGFLNSDCNECEAKKLVGKRVKIGQSESARRSPYSIACKKHGGKVVIGKLYSGNQQSFCRMSDKSIVSTNTLL
jgi:hypothetical protein